MPMRANNPKGISLTMWLMPKFHYIELALNLLKTTFSTRFSTSLQTTDFLDCLAHTTYSYVDAVYCYRPN